MNTDSTTLYKLMILYMLSKVNFPLSNTQLSTAIRDDIETYLFDNKYELKNEAGTVTDCYKLSNGNYIAHCQLKEGDTTLIELNLNVPVEEQAEIICARWRENSQEVYDYIVRKLM